MARLTLHFARLRDGEPRNAPYRFLVAGGLAAALNWVVRFPFELVMPYSLALLAALAVGMIFGFGLYQNWVFPGSERPLTAQLRDFIVVNIVGQIIMFVVAILLREALLSGGVAVVVAGGAAHLVGIAVGAVANYLGHRHFTFAQRSDP